jgi:hypothetical protein
MKAISFCVEVEDEPGSLAGQLVMTILAQALLENPAGAWDLITVGWEKKAVNVRITPR